MSKGKVYIIGAGPGDHKLMTIKAAECMAKADVIVYDRLVSSRILSYAKDSALFINVGKRPDNHPVPQSDINKILVDKASEGNIVARIKGGDPFLFGRGAEEAEFLAKNNIDFEIIPGVSSAIAVPAYAGIPVTHRDYNSSLHIVTGHEKSNQKNTRLDFKTLAGLEGTIVFLMGVKNIGFITLNLIKNGKKKSTPCAVISNGTTSYHKVITGTLEDIAKKAASGKINPPAVIVIGNVVNLQKCLEWFPKGPLAGKRILVTRAREQASDLVKKIEEKGGEALEFPAIKIAEIESYDYFDKVLKNIRDYKWVVFTSINGVSTFFKRMKVNNIDIRDLSGIKIAAIGETTAEKISNLGLRIDYVPNEYTSEKLLEGLLNLVRYSEKVLLVRADIAGNELFKGLEKNGIKVKNLVAYRITVNDFGKDKVMDLLEEGSVDYITFTSSSTVINFVSILGKENINKLSRVKIICIGPVTEKTAADIGLKVSAVADVYTIEGLIDKMIY
ncbi:MAG: uroporphyrinogen-III C-methyltransferase [Candidatus Humimicrobiaceae bacterium]